MTGIESFIYAYLALWLIPFGLIVYLAVKVHNLSKRIEELRKQSLRQNL